jgi:hypothetical protein
MTKYELDHRTPMTYPYIKSQLNTYNCWGDNEQKLKLSLIQSKRGITRTQPVPSFNMSNLSWMCTAVGEIMNENRKILFCFKVKGHNSVKNHRTMNKFDFDLHIPVAYPYHYFELNVHNCLGDNERKLKISFL